MEIMRQCNDCGRSTFNHNPNKGIKKCPDCKQPWSCDMCDNDDTKRGGTPAGETCYMCHKGWRLYE